MAKKDKNKGKTPRINTKPRFNELNHRLDAYSGAVDELYHELERDVANLAASTTYQASAGSMFRFASFPAAFQAFKKLMNTYLADISFVVDRGTRQEWERAETDHDRMVTDIIRQYGGDATDKKFAGYLAHKTDARDAFLKQQKTGTHGWSERVWNLNDQVQQEMELAVSASFADGTSAATLATQMKQYLQEPDRLYRRVRNEYGELVLSKNAAAYHPGPGIYRSSYKNALRLTRTEINMAYRNADQERYQQEDFVVGYEIKLSGSHPCPDICDTLAGKYPKDFQWSGWHPNDLCYIVPILKTEDEFFNDDESTPSVNEVQEPPAAYRQYMEDNAERLEAARQRGTLPYWVRDNYQIGKNGGFRPLFGISGFNSNPSFSGEENILIPGEIQDITQVQDIMSNYAIANPTYFPRGYKGIRAVSQSKGYMGTDCNGDIWVNFATDANGFNPGECLNRAMTKIHSGEKLLKEEEYSIEALWHEINHNRVNKVFAVPGIDTPQGFTRVAVETTNQLVSRKTYFEFLSDIGGAYNAKNAQWVLEHGYGYSTTVENMRELLRVKSIDEDDFIRQAEGLLFQGYKSFDKRIGVLLNKMSGDETTSQIFGMIELDVFSKILKQ